MKRRPIIDALLAQLQALTAEPYEVQVISQGYVVWSDADIQPAIYYVPVREEAKYSSGLPTKWMMHGDLWVYVRQSTIELGVQTLMDLMDGIEEVLSPMGSNGMPTKSNTLGGLVTYCAIQGQAEISGGFLNQQQTVARIPIEILTA